INADAQENTIAALRSQPVKRSCGGSAANTVIALQQFGGQGYFTCKVADDEAGRFFASDLHHTGVHSNLQLDQLDTTAATGKCLVMVTDDADRTLHTYLGISEYISTKELNTSAIEAADFVYLEGYLVTSPTGRDAAIQTHALAHAKNTRVAMTFSDPNMVNFFRDGLSEMAGDHLDLLFCNEQEALQWATCTTLQQAVEALKTRADTFVITLGARGALIYDGQRCTTLPGNPVRATDTVGAGDMFAGAFLYAITHGHDYLSAGNLAIAASAELVKTFGARLSLDAQQAILKTWRTTQVQAQASTL
ncbi:MAG: adenosine kinase, partial [Gammaproteobacteria bacterium]